MNKNKTRNSELNFSIWGNPITSVISALNLGRTGDFGTVTVSANSTGYKINLRGRTIARGSTAEELHASFRKEVNAAVAKNAKGA